MELKKTLGAIGISLAIGFSSNGAFPQNEPVQLEAIVAQIPQLSEEQVVRRSIASYTFCLPQTLLGHIKYFLWDISGKIEQEVEHNELRIVYSSEATGSCSMGRFIFLGDRFQDYGKDLLLHEIGHSYQGLEWGPFFLPIIGLPSCTFWAVTRLFPSTFEQYWKMPWELDANKRMGIEMEPKYSPLSQQ